MGTHRLLRKTDRPRNTTKRHRIKQPQQTQQNTRTRPEITNRQRMRKKRNKHRIFGKLLLNARGEGRFRKKKF